MNQDYEDYVIKFANKHCMTIEEAKKQAIVIEQEKEYEGEENV